MIRREEKMQIQSGKGPQQRGSVLVIVIGMLALMSVTTVIYLAIGRGDRRASGIVVQKNDIEDSMVRFGDYISSIIAEDALATFVDGEANFGLGLEPVIRREAIDYPWTDYLMRSDVTSLGADEYAFNPIGTFDELWTGSGVDLRQPSDPWLASTEPTWLNFDSNPPTNEDILESSRDWAQISNIAPDGRFVNLFNLRGHFDAEPGVSLSGDPKLSDDLTLFKKPVDPAARAVPEKRLDFDSRAPDPDIPAHWGMRQRAMFRPAGVGAVDGGWRDSEFHPYQYVDADGDGMLDSRWVELKDASDPADIRSTLPEDDRYRYFLGVRIIDLSGLINLNTATSFRDEPTRSAPAGYYPGDIDLRRLLTLQDPYYVFDIPGVEFGYEFLDQPSAPGLGEADYAGVTPVIAYDIGALGYNGLRSAIWDMGGVPGMPYTAGQRADFYIEYGAGQSGVVSMFDVAGAFIGYQLGSPFTMDDQFELLTYRGVNNPESLTNLERALGANGDYAILRDNRSLSLERGGMDNEGYGIGVPNGAPDDDAMVWSQIDPRQRLTTMSGARPLGSGVVLAQDVGRLNQDVDLVPDLFAGTGALGSGVNLGDLYGLYANALAPYLEEQKDLWDDTSMEELRTLNFGHARPDLALRMAAHMSLNLADSYDAPLDGNHEPRAATLLLTDDPNFTDINNPLEFPWWQDPATSLYLGDGFHSQDMAELGGNPAAINVFGTEAQPFLAEVAHAIMYTDAPNAVGGDRDWDDNDPPVGNPNITIDGRVVTGNVDFLAEAVAFQITNPFDSSISLAVDNAGTIEPIYYIEFGGKIYAADVPVDDSKLAAGETKVFYALSQDTLLIQGRWERVQSLPPSLGDVEVRQWVRAQFALRDNTGTPIEPVRLTEFNPLTGVFQPNVSFGITQLLSPTPQENRVAHLWRTMLPNGETFANNLRENDLLSDRLRDPAIGLFETLNNRMPASNEDITGTRGGPEGTSTEEDNTGYSITLWSSIRRPSDSGAVAATGGLPAWCIEVNSTVPWAPPNSSKNTVNSDPSLNPNSLTQGDFTGEANGYTTMPLLVTDQAPVIPIPDNVLNDTLVKEPKSKTGASIGSNLATRPYSELRPQTHLDNQGFADSGGNLRFRTADLLLPMAVGPYQNPLAANLDEQWTTLGEALALALYYDARPAGDTLFELAGNVAGTIPAKVDRGQLALYEFVPFFNTDGDPAGVYERDPAGDLVRYPGIPLAMNVLNMARTMSPGFGSLAEPVLGVVNINTAPLSVLRMLPMLSPSLAIDPGTGNPEWWDAAGTDGLFDALGSGLELVDIAAAVQAYRDKIMVPHRTDVLAELLDYVDLDTSDNQVPPDDPINFNGRSVIAAVDAIREQPGFASLGEVLAVVNASTASSMDTLATDTMSVDHVGVELTLVENGTGAGGAPDGLVNDYDEQLVIANALINNISVRSDIFCAWFVVHGYQRSDVEGLDRDEPLLPSIARRYVMIVDRSNVTRSGEKPRILLFEEVPL